MKLFQQLLLAPAALGLLAPMAASAADLNLDAVNKYAGPEEQVTSITQFSDVQPTAWAYQALSNLIERYGCVAGYPNGTFKGGQPLTRWEAAALLNACLDRITEVTDELKKLLKEFQKELAVLRGRVDGLEAKVGELEANQFSTTTKLKGYAAFVVGANSYGGNSNLLKDINKAGQGGTTFNYDLRLDLDTSFTGKDLLRTRLRAGNFGKSAFAGSAFPLVGLSALETAFEEPAGPNVVSINRLYYQFPVGSGFTVTAGPRVRQDDMLALWPSAYPADTVLDVFTYAGAPGAYSLNLGGGAGIWWAKNGFSISTNYVSANANVAEPTAGGIGTTGAASTFTAQVGYAKANYGLAFAYNYAQNGNNIYAGNATPSALAGFVGNSNNYGLSAFWSPKTSGWFPSISTGWGYSNFQSNSVQTVKAVQNWYVGIQWADAFIKGNTLGMAVGQPTFVTSQTNGTPRDGNYAWEWWYKFQVTDNISVTPAIFYLSQPLGQAPANFGISPSGALNNFGGLVKTTFKF